MRYLIFDEGSKVGSFELYPKQVIVVEQKMNA